MRFFKKLTAAALAAAMCPAISIGAAKALDTDYLHGDVNGDGRFTIADAVALENWLLGCGTLTSWQSADMCQDGIIDTYDLLAMKKLLAGELAKSVTLSASTSGIGQGAYPQVTFTVDAGSFRRYIIEDGYRKGYGYIGVNLYNADSGSFIAALNDSGQNGDQTAGDYIWSASINVDNSAAGTLSYCALAYYNTLIPLDREYSNTISIEVFPLDPPEYLTYSALLHFIGYSDALWQIAHSGDSSAVVTSTDELEEFLAPVTSEETLRAYLSRYDESFFADNVLLLNCIYQSCGADIMYQIEQVYYNNGRLNVEYSDKYNYFMTYEDVVNGLLAEVTIPKEQYHGEPVDWLKLEKPTID